MRNALLLLTLILTATASAQSRNVAYVELGGNGVFATVNYERQLAEQWFGRAGFSAVTVSDENDTDLTFVVPLMVNYLTNPGSAHHLEAGAGITFVAGDSQDLYGDEDDDQISNVAGTATLGYRYQKPARGFVFRAGFTPLFDGSGILPWAGVSFGYRW